MGLSSSERLAARAARLRVRIVESEAGSLHGDDIVDGGAGKQLMAAVVDEDLDPAALDHGVVGTALADEAHFVLISGAASRLHHNPQPVDRIGGTGYGCLHRVYGAVR